MSLGFILSDDRRRLTEAAARPSYQTVRQTVQTRDDHSCAACGFKSTKYQDIAPKKSVPMAQAILHNPDDWETLCLYCAQVRDVAASAAMKSGVLIWLPELSQEALNHLMRAIYVARVSQGPMADAARRVLDMLMRRREDLKAKLGSDDPVLLSNVVEDFLTPRHRQALPDKLAGIRLLPLDRRTVKEGEVEFNQFPQILAFWRSKDGPFGSHLPAAWITQAKHILEAADPTKKTTPMPDRLEDSA